MSLRYPLVIIDESHNFRNNEGKRYKELQEYLREHDSKVILMTATPYNKSFIDLYSQIALFIDEYKELPLRPEKYILELGNVDKFKSKHQCEPNSLKAFSHSEIAEDWQNLMRYVLIRRTRGFIKSICPKDEKGNPYLDVKNSEKLYFSERKIDKVEFSLKDNDKEDQYAMLYSELVTDNIKELELPRYGLKPLLVDDYHKKAKKEELEIIKTLSYASKRLQGFAKVNLFKRLESSGFSFLLSVSRHILRNYFYLFAIENNKPIPFGKHESYEVELLDDDSDEQNHIDANDITFSLNSEDYNKKAEELHNEISKQKEKFRWLKSSLFDPKLKENLEHDNELLFEILGLANSWEVDNDRKLKELYKFCIEKYKDKKILIFSQYADTVRYISNYFIAKILTLMLQLQVKLQDLT